MCGCNSIIITDKLKKDIIDTQPILKYGIAFGEEEIDYSIKTRQKLIDNIKKIDIDQYKNTLNFFTKKLNLFPTK